MELASFKKILIIGFYNRGNIGDEAFKPSFKKLLSPVENYTTSFICVDDIVNVNAIDYDVIIIGGGDIFNNYFVPKIELFLSKYKNLLLAVGIGIPFMSIMDTVNLKKYNAIFTRNAEDVSIISSYSHSMRARFLPDIVFTLECPLKGKSIIIHRDTTILPKCGIFLVQNTIKFKFLTKSITRLLNTITKTHRLIFYVFNTGANPHENDEEISRYIADKIKTKTFPKIINNISDPFKMLSSIQSLSMGVCVRFHSHIFCMLANIPFISISTCRKTRVLMTQVGLQHNQYMVPLDGHGTPLTSKSSDLISVYHQLDRVKTKEIIRSVVKEYKEILKYNQISQIINRYRISPLDDALLYMKSANYNCDNLAKLVSRRCLGVSDTKYVYGIYEKLMATPTKNHIDVVKESIFYLKPKRTSRGGSISSVSRSFSSSSSSSSLFDRTIPVYLDITEYSSYKNAHRGGWYDAISTINKNKSHSGIYCDFYIDRTFLWNEDIMLHRNIIPYTISWCGFIHHTAFKGVKNNILELFKKDSFLISLKMCRILFTLSPSLADTIRTLLDIHKINVKVVSLVHPVVLPTIMFSNEKTPKYLVQIGSWLRNAYSMYALEPVTSLKKAILLGEDMDDMILPTDLQIKKGRREYTVDHSHLQASYPHIAPCRDYCESIPRTVMDLMKFIIKNYSPSYIFYEDNCIWVECIDFNKLLRRYIRTLNNTSIIKKLENKKYDKLLSKSVVFLDLYDSATVNTVIECIVRETPLIINKTNGVIDLLGDNYPSYYDSSANQTQINKRVSDLLKSSNIKKTVKYLRELDKTKFKIEHFVQEFQKCIS